MTDLYADLERIEKRGKRIAEKSNGNSDGPTFATRLSEPGEGNGGEVEESRSQGRQMHADSESEKSKPCQKDIYADLENIEKRGKRKKSGKSFFFNRRKG